jgi:hypothetical protein
MAVLDRLWAYLFGSDKSDNQSLTVRHIRQISCCLSQNTSL